MKHDCFDNLVFAEALIETGVVAPDGYREAYTEAAYVCEVCQQAFDIDDTNAEMKAREEAAHPSG